MQEIWLKYRKDMFIRDLTERYLEVKLFFDKLYREYKKKRGVNFKKMDYWVGTETKKGVLWNLKDQCHILFRNRKSKLGLCEYIFDWTLGSIFHEGMKMKEDIYQLSSYRQEGIDLNLTNLSSTNIQEIHEEFSFVIGKAEENFADEMERINYLFYKANSQLTKFLPKYSQNGLLLRFFFNNRDLAEKACGKNFLDELFSSMFPGNPEKAYIVAGEDCSRGGWWDEGKKILQEGTKRYPDNPKVKKELEKMEKHWEEWNQREGGA